MGQQGGEYEPRDSRNVTGTSTNQTGDRWSEKARDGLPPSASGTSSQAGGGLAQAQSGWANPAAGTGEPESPDTRFNHTLEAAPRDDSRREMMNNQNNQPPTAAQDQNQGATGEQPDGTFGQRENPSQGGFASGQQNQSDESTSIGQGGMGQAGSGQAQAGQAQAGNAGQAGYGGQQQQASGQAGSGQAGYNAGQQSQFDSGDAGQFRDQLREHMDVVDANGEHCGTIDSIDGDRIKLTRKDSTDGQHHYVEMGQVAGIEGGQVRLNSTSQAGDADSNAADNWNS